MSTVIFAIDCEFRGESYSQHGLLAVGVAISHGGHVTKLTWNVAPMPAQGYSVNCWDTFWSTREELRKRLETNPIEWSTWARMFRKLVDEWNAKGDLYIIASSHSDVEYINYYLDSAKLPLLQFDRNGQYRHIHDSESYTRGWIGAKPESQWVNDTEVAAQSGLLPVSNEDPHNPAADAHAMMQFHLQLVQKKPDHAPLSNMICIGRGH